MTDPNERFTGKTPGPIEFLEKYRIYFDTADAIQKLMADVGISASESSAKNDGIGLAYLTLLSHTGQSYYASMVLCAYGLAAEAMVLSRKLIENWITAFYMKANPRKYCTLYNVGEDISRIIWTQRAIETNDVARLPDGVGMDVVRSNLAKSAANLAVYLRPFGFKPQEVPETPEAISRRFRRSWSGIDVSTMLTIVTDHFGADSEVEGLKMFHEYGYRMTSEYVHSSGISHGSVRTRDLPGVYFRPGPKDELIDSTLTQCAITSLGVTGIAIEHLKTSNPEALQLRYSELSNVTRSHLASYHAKNKH